MSSAGSAPESTFTVAMPGSASLPGSTALGSRQPAMRRKSSKPTHKSKPILSPRHFIEPDAPQKAREDQTWAEYLADRQIKFSLRLIIAVALAHQVPALHPLTNKLIHIQYYDPVTDTAAIGIDDAYFVFSWIVTLVFIRAALIKYIFMPFCRGTIRSRKTRVRFAEQGWSVTYYVVAWLVGMYLLAGTDYAWSAKHIWIGWPHYQISRLMKAYYLIQLSCWLSQIYVLNIEEKRKDYVQMFTHHIVTCLLVTGSYYYYYTRVGHVILVMMDVLDVLLSSAKMLKYMGFSTACDAMFLVFLVSWVSLRHGLFNYYTWSAVTDGLELIETKCYYDDSGAVVRCFTPNVHYFLVAMLVVLQVIFLIWLWMIIRVVIGILRGGSAEDSRSDDEDD